MKNNFLLFLLLFFSIILSASNIVKLNYNSQKIENFKVGYILDEDNSLSLKSIKEMQFRDISNQHSFGNTKATLWIKLELKNITDIKKWIFIHNNFAYFSKSITVYEIKNSKLVDQNLYNILEDKESNKLTGSTLIYPVKLDSQSSTIIYFKTEPMITQTAQIGIYTNKKHHEALLRRSFFSSSIIFILLSLAFYNIFIFFYNKKKEFLYYSFYLINASIGLSYMYGIVFDFGFYGEKVHWLNLSAILVSTFLALFIKSIFKFKQGNIFLDKLLNSMIYLSSLNFLVLIFIDMQLGMTLLCFLYLYTFIVILYIAYKLYQQKNPLATIFLSAYLIYIIGFSLTLLSLQGFIPLNSFTFYASGISLIFEALLFSYLINYQIKMLENKLTEQGNSLLLKNQKEQMGEMIGAITHQWKQPLNTISSIVMLLQYKLDEDICESKYIKEKLSKINTSLHFLDDTVNDFRSFFSNDKIFKDCDLEQLINKAINLSKDDTLTHQILINKDLRFTRTVNIIENELLHILLNIIQNSKEAFRDTNINEKHIKMIKIIGRTKDDGSYIDIIDNAGGISKDYLPYIFQESYTTKKNKKGSGLGLYLSKIIIEDHMNGTIEAKNIGNGTMFRIKL